ncbi:MAG: tetratricopeptide repeat protein [Inhella sp.]
MPVTDSSPPGPTLRRLRDHLLRGQDRQALLLGQALTAEHPEMGEAWNLLGVAAQREGQPNLALTAKRKAAQLLPHRPDVHINLANTLRQQGELEEACACLQLALRLKPDDAAAHNLLGLVRQRQGHIEPAQQSFEAALRCDPNFVQAHSNLLFMLTHEGSLSPAELRDAHLRFGAMHGSPLRSQWPQHANLRDLGKRLRVGFVSADLRNHAVARFIAPIWRAFDRSQLELVAYQAHWRRDAYTDELQTLCDEWVQVAGLNDAELAARIQADGIDILFDLSGHTAHNRLMCFARKPAPVQITAIGYPHSTGLEAVDYRITDTFRTPPQLASQCVEHLVWIPSSSTFEHGEAPEVAPLPASLGHPFTFGSFQRPNKIGPASLDLWAAVLHAVPQSRMLLGAIDGAEARQRLQEALEVRGIARQRLAFHGVQPLQQYLALHAQIDLLLDTVPYPAGTTAHHGLWMGVPTLTRTGDSFVSWQCAGILGRLGLQAFIAHDDATFVAMAKTWSQQLRSLGQLRASLRARIGTHPLVQPATVAAGIQAALREMWRRWCAGLPAASFEVRLEP